MVGKIIRAIDRYVNGDKADNPRAASAYLVQKAKSGMTAWGNQLKDENPDDLVVSKGGSVDVYQKMASEPYVKAALKQLKYAVLRWPWTIKPGGEDEQSIQLAADIRENLEHLEGQSMSMVLWAVMDGLDCGYSIAEKIMKRMDDGSYGYRKIQSLDTYYYKPGVDDYGNLVDIVADGVKGLTKERFDPRYFLVYTHMPRYCNPFGQSELRAAYRAYFIKDAAWKFRSLYMQKYGTPPLVGTVKAGVSSDIRDELLTIMKNVQQESNIVLTSEMQMEALEIGTSGNSIYHEAISDLNMEILIGILGSFMTVAEGANTGARALGEVHEDSVDRAAAFVATQLEDTLNEQLIWPMVRMNKASIEDMPYFCFDRTVDIDRDAEANLLLKASKLGVAIPKAHGYERLGIPMPEDGEEVLEPVSFNPFGNPDGQMQDKPKTDDIKLIDIREKFWHRLEPLYIDITAECFDKIKKSGVLAAGDMLKASDMALPVNVGRVKKALTDALMYGNAVGRGSQVDTNSNMDKCLIDSGMSADEFSESLRAYDKEAARLAGIVKDRLSKDIRKELLATVAERGTEQTLWQRLRCTITGIGLNNYTDAPDVEAFSIGYNDGLRHAVK